METQFWLDDITELINIENFQLNGSEPQRKTKMLNLVAVFSIIFGGIFYKKTQNKMSLLTLKIPISPIYLTQNSTYDVKSLNSSSVG